MPSDQSMKVNEILSIYRVISYAKPTNWQEESTIINLYDKNMTTLVAWMNYDAAIKSNNLSQIQIAKQKVKEMIDQALHAYSEIILSSRECKYNPDYYEQHLDEIKKEFNEYLELNDPDLRKLWEVTLFKLSVLSDKARGMRYDERLDELLTLSIKNYMNCQRICHEFPHPKSIQILPIFSSNGTNGLNTMLCAIFNYYFK